MAKQAEKIKQLVKEKEQIEDDLREAQEAQISTEEVEKLEEEATKYRRLYENLLDKIRPFEVGSVLVFRCIPYCS